MDLAKNSLDERLDLLKAAIEQPNLRKSTGKANEVNYWVFDYDPADELKVRAYIEELKVKENNGKKPFQLVVFDLYDIIMDYLESRNFIKKCSDIEQRKGIERVATAIQNSIRITDKNNYIVNYIAAHMPDNAIVFLTGIGKCFPILQAPEVFNMVLYNMPSEYSTTPMILFYPGIYTEQELIIFNELKENNYYRAFRIVR